jgi:hypothetical protein
LFLAFNAIVAALLHAQEMFRPHESEVELPGSLKILASKSFFRECAQELGEKLAVDVQQIPRLSQFGR